ncbi:MAG: hypothetical protein PHW63_00885 [Alphaproteobacteria bacterium]|nr:hypothetical protein [Alphaproteobacteria bacterium]
MPLVLHTSLPAGHRPVTVRNIFAAFQRNARKALLQVKDIKLPTPTLGHVPKGDPRWRAQIAPLAPNVQRPPTPGNPQGRSSSSGSSSASLGGSSGGGKSGGGTDDDEATGLPWLLRFFGFPKKGHGATVRYRSWLGRIVTETITYE